MTAAKIIRLRYKKIPGRRKSGDQGSYLTGIGTIPERMEPIEKLVRADRGKAEATLVYLANRNKEGISPSEYFDFMYQALGLDEI